MEQTNLFGFILSAIERRLATYFGDDKNLVLDMDLDLDLNLNKKVVHIVNDKKEIYTQGILPSYSADNFEKCKDFNMDTIDFNQTKTVKFSKVTPIMEEDCENPHVHKVVDQVPFISIDVKEEYCDMV